MTSLEAVLHPELSAYGKMGRVRFEPKAPCSFLLQLFFFLKLRLLFRLQSMLLMGESLTAEVSELLSLKNFQELPLVGGNAEGVAMSPAHSD
jgi:hypothetical protein